MIAVFHGTRSIFRQISLIAALVLSGVPSLPPLVVAQTASEAYANRDALVRTGLEANRKTLEIVVEYAIALEGVWNEKLAGSTSQPPPIGTIPDKTNSLNVAVRAGLQDLHRSLERAVRLQTEASSTRDGKLALLLATDAASWTNRALYAAQELRTPLSRHVAAPLSIAQAAPGATALGGAAPGTTAPGTTASGTTAPGTTAPGTTAPGTTAPGTTAPGTTAPGAPRVSAVPGLAAEPSPNMAALNRYLDQLSGRSSTTPASGAGVVPAGRPARNMEELNRYLDELSGRTPVDQTGQPGAAPRPAGSPPRNMAELFRYLDELSGRTAGPNTWDAPLPPPPSLAVSGSRFASNLTGLFQHVDELSGANPIQADLDFVQRNAEDEFSQGRAGAGGIALFKAAEMLSPLPLETLQGVAWKDKQFVMRFTDREIAFPRIDPEYLAQAVRCVYHGEGTYEGKLIADESNAMVIQTGRSRFGELVWRKQFLSTPWTTVPIGSTVQVELGPGLGLLAELAPSTDRVTYYGPIQNTRMGKVFLESDQVISLLYHGVDPRTGRPTRPAIDRFQTFFERNVREMLAHRPPANAPAQPAAATAAGKPRPWWTGATWMVWVPDRFSLRLVGDGKQLEFVDARMKLDTWVAGQDAVSGPYAAFGSDITANYDTLAKEFPALQELREVAKAVGVIRWLKQQKVVFDVPDWARTYPIQNVATPATVPRFSVEPVLGFEKGLPIPMIDKETVR
jgi:hypothetical protein